MSEPKLHALLSPSGADRWMTCLGSVALTKDLPDTENEYSVEGTDYHELAALCLEQEEQAIDYIGHEMASGKNTVTEENAKFLQDGYIDVVRAMVGDGTLYVEARCPISHLTGEKDACGTADAVIVKTDRELIIVDLKFGRGVEVSPEHNRQCMIYALGVIEQYQLLESIDQVRLVICQPRTGDGKPKEWVVRLQDLLVFGVEVTKVARAITLNAGLASMGKVGEDLLPLVPSTKACKFCKAKATCPALASLAETEMMSGFTDESKPAEIAEVIRTVVSNYPNPAEVLGRKMDKVDLLEIYLLGVRSAVEMELLAGHAVIGEDGPYKLVQGKKGNRKWDSEEDVVTLFKKTFRMKKSDMYDLSLISPTTAEKRLKKAHPQRWADTEEHITQSEGAKHVADAKDPRPAIEVGKPEDGFAQIGVNDDLL